MTSLNWNDRHDFAQAVLRATENIANAEVLPAWIDDRHFWYERRDSGGYEYAIVDAATGDRRTVVTRRQLADALSSHLDARIDADILIIADIRVNLDGRIFGFTAFGDSYDFAWMTGTLSAGDARAIANELTSPDGSNALFVRDDNLWLRDLATGHASPLTRDGCELNAYGGPALTMRSVFAAYGGCAPEASWSPDSRWILSLQTDDSQVPELPLMEYAPPGGGRPQVHPNRTSLPGDATVTEFRMIAIEVATGRQVEADYPRLTAVRMNAPLFESGMAWWSVDCKTAWFIHVERGEQAAHVVAFDVATGATRVVFSERSDSYVELSVNPYWPVLASPLPETHELIWYSERTGRGHLYLVDLVTGAVRNAITHGQWQVRDVIAVDAQRREVFFLAGGVAANENPYIVKPCIASFGGEVRIVSHLPGEHRLFRPRDMGLRLRKIEGVDGGAICGLSPGGDYFVEQVSSVTELPRTWLRTREGVTIALLEQASGALPKGWQDPEPVDCMAADGVTKTYGLLFRPLGYDPSARYPVIDLIYGGVHVSHVSQASFASGALTSFVDAMFLSATGAFVLVLDGRGTAHRERAFRTASWGAVHTASNIEDHMAAIRQIAQTHCQIDPDRVGITGLSGGGYAAALAALRFGAFFKVAVAGAGNYDQALFWHTWGERYHGAYDADLYAVQAARTYAAGMTGKLMLVHGFMDGGCHPAGFMQLVQALIEANKDPDLVILPRGGHDWSGYGLRRLLDYFAEHLCGQKPSITEPFTRPVDSLMARIAANRIKPGQAAKS